MPPAAGRPVAAQAARAPAGGRARPGWPTAGRGGGAEGRKQCVLLQRLTSTYCYVAFLAGAGVIATGILLAFVLLRPVRSEQPELQLARDAQNDTTTLPANFDIEETPHDTEQSPPPPHHHAQPGRPPLVRPERRPGEARSIGLVSEAVVARYIHDISDRRRPVAAERRS